MRGIIRRLRFRKLRQWTLPGKQHCLHGRKDIAVTSLLKSFCLIINEIDRCAFDNRPYSIEEMMFYDELFDK
jgi:hypothetical protein